MAAPRRPGVLPRLLLLLLLGLAAAAAGAPDQAGDREPGTGGRGPPQPLTGAVPLCPSQVCGCCAGPVRNGSAVAALCGSRAGAVLRGRCCVEGLPEQEAVVGLDLGNCSLHRLCSGFQEASTAFVIDLTGNPLERLPEDAFRGFTLLQTLALPQALDCPGGREGWDNVTLRGSYSRICQGQRNPCNGSGGLGRLCPEDSVCAPDGPGLPQCLCIGPFHGYKCLRQGTFPSLLFFGTLGVATATLSILLWATQRRKAKSS